MIETWFNKISQDIKKLILLPAEFWREKKSEQVSGNRLIIYYFVPLLLVLGLAVFIGELFSGSHLYPVFPLLKAVRKIVLFIIMYFFSVITVKMLLNFLSLNYNIQIVHRLILFSFIPFILISIITGLLPFLYVVNITGVYSLYIFWKGFREFFDLSDKIKYKYIYIAVLIIFVLFSLISVLLSKLLTIL